MNFYENLIILDPNLNDKAVEEVVERVKDVIIKKGGEILKSENWGHKKLAYEIKKHKKGTYILLLFKSPPFVIGELERFYRVFEPILKSLVIKLKKKQIEAAVSAMTGTNSRKKAESATLGTEDKSV
jgi:small subunit ribosomal protein S6